MKRSSKCTTIRRILSVLFYSICAVLIIVLPENGPFHINTAHTNTSPVYAEARYSDTHPDYLPENPTQLQDIPENDGQLWTTLHDNIPFFSIESAETIAQIHFEQLDELNRSREAWAILGPELLPVENEQRSSLSSIKPAGYQSIQDEDGNYIWNRCHLIAWQLGGPDAVENIITGTRSFNVEGMLPIENEIADYIRNTGNHVLYRVTPLYEEDNLITSGVIMEAMSIEDNGEGICLNGYCGNSQDHHPGCSSFRSSGIKTHSNPEPITCR